MFGRTRLHQGAARVGFGRRLLATTAAAVLGVSVLAGCASGQISQTADQVPNHDGGVGTIGAISVANALVGDSTERETAVAFPKGSAVPVSLWVTNNAPEADTLTSISSSVGDVKLSGTATIPGQGQLEIGGSSDVTASIESATADVKYGFSVTLDLYFARAGKLTFKVPVEIPAERSGDRATTDIYPSEETNLWHDPISDNG